MVAEQAISQEQDERISFPLKLFGKSVLKQRKYKELTAMLGPVNGRDCIDIGSDNGVISYLFREQGGKWKSADLDDHAVQAIRSMVGSDVYQIDGGRTPFADNEFDAVVIVDFLEHIPDDHGFMQEVKRILKPGGVVIMNVPHLKNSLLRRFRIMIGQTDEKHGHLRPGYTPAMLQELVGDDFTIRQQYTYSKFFSEFIDTMIVFAVSVLKSFKGEKTDSQKGLVVTGDDLSANKSMFKVYSLIYPVVRAFSLLDHLLFFRKGYMLIASATNNKQE